MSTEEDRIWHAELDRRIEDEEQGRTEPEYDNRRLGEPGLLIYVQNFLDRVEDMDLGPLDHFTCSEVTALADLMAADRGEEEGTKLIMYHLVGGDEEQEELEQHLHEWPTLAAMLRRNVSPDVRIMGMLTEATDA